MPASLPTASTPTRELSESRKLLLGATFTNEYAIEGAALCNPSIVAHPDQTDMPAGSLRFVMSVRGIGEGHRSSIGFRTGVVDAAGHAHIDDASAVRDHRTCRDSRRSTRPSSATSSARSASPERSRTTSSVRSVTASRAPIWTSDSTACAPT